MLTIDDVFDKYLLTDMYGTQISPEHARKVIEAVYPIFEDALIAASMPSEVRNQKLLPFETERDCQKCGAILVMIAPGWWKRKLWHLRGQVYSGYNIAHCAGGRPPEDTRDVLTPFGKQEIKQTFPCAGVTEDHLHIVCQRCGFHLLMQVAER
jgi:hypothetical protein